MELVGVGSDVIAGPAWTWPGGKRDLLDQLRPLRPRAFGRYFEPFVGAGAMFWDVIHSFDGPCFLSDANPDLVLVYRMIRDRVESLIDALAWLASQPATNENFLDRRAAYNSRNLVEVDRAAHLIFLVQTSFNGLYRVSGNGFNAAFGYGSHSNVLDADLLRACSAVLRRGNVHIARCDWREALDFAQCGDYVYLDCPYAPATSTEKFTSYTVDGFTLQDQRDLAAAFRALTRSGVQCMLSNSDTPLVRDLYSGFDITEVTRGGRMNCKGDRRGRVTELVIRGGYAT